MRRIVQSLIFSIATSNIAYAAPAISNKLNYKAKKQSSFRKVVSNFNFNYFAQYTGRSLSDNYDSGATYNRFDGGTSEDGKKYDATGSTQVYQSFKLGYKLPNNMIVSYGITYQDNMTDDVEYTQLGGSKAQRNNGRSMNNHRAALWMPSILSNNKGSLSLSLFIEEPTYKSTNTINETAMGGPSFDKVVATNSTEVDMEYKGGVGFQPTISIYSKVPGLYHGISASYERYVYPEYTKTVKKHPFWCERKSDCSGIDKDTYEYKAQGAKANFGGYLNYSLNDRVTLKSSVEFDYDQVGDQVGSLSDWGNNMDNIGNLGASYSASRLLTLEGGVNFSLEEASIDKSAIFGSLNLSI